jgi:hypothetical protein
LTNDINYIQEPCRLCNALPIKNRKIDKLEANMQRWLSDGDLPATVERVKEELGVLKGQARDLRGRHDMTRSLRPPPRVRKARISHIHPVTGKESEEKPKS